MFWKRLMKGYLPALTERKRWQMEKRNFKMRYLVFISNKNMHCSDWLLARVIEIRPRRDDVVR